METEIIESLDKPKKPAFLKVLCILTFIGVGFGALVCIIMPFISKSLYEMMTNAPGFDPDKQRDAMIALTAPTWYYMVLLVLIIINLIGTIMMWRLNKNGFYIYLAAQVISNIFPILAIDMPISYFGIFITIAFIVMYGVNFKHLK